MHILDLVTIVVVGLMAGNELAVSAFVNPAIWKHNDRQQAAALAISLGAFMPGWYVLSILLLIAEAVQLRHAATFLPAAAAAALGLVVVVFTLTALVPLNNQLARTPLSDSGFDWLRVHRRWDARHRIRIAMLVAAFALSTGSVLAR